MRERIGIIGDGGNRTYFEIETTEDRLWNGENEDFLLSAEDIEEAYMLEEMAEMERYAEELEMAEELERSKK